MTLAERFYSLPTPKTADPNTFSVCPHTPFEYVKVGRNYRGFPAILISTEFAPRITKKNLRFKYVDIAFDLRCRVSEQNTFYLSEFLLIQLKTDSRSLIGYFLQVCEILINNLSKKPSQEEFEHVFTGFAEIFRAISNPATTTIQGLWTELFLIDCSLQPVVMLDYWHQKPADKFDFNADVEKVEVKSSNLMERIHNFSAEQLSPLSGTQVLIASIFAKQSSEGLSLGDLMHSIQKRVCNEESIAKMHKIVAQTLGASLAEALDVKFDSRLARRSLRYFRHQDVQKIEAIHIPTHVWDVRFRSDLGVCEFCDLDRMTKKGPLFSALPPPAILENEQ